MSDSDYDDEEVDADDEVLYGVLQVPIVGIRYYRGVVHRGEWVELVREPENPYDRNAIRVDNQYGIQVGHIGRDYAYSMRPIMDGIGEYSTLRIECTIPKPPTGVYRIGALVSIYGPRTTKEHLSHSIKARIYQFRPIKGDRINAFAPVKSSVTKLTPTKTQEELNKMFDNLEKKSIEKVTTSIIDFDDRIKPLRSTLFSHQVFGIKWMIRRESAESELPPFWEKKQEKGKLVFYYNSITASSTSRKPKNIVGGILADDMGLGKTVQMIALVVSNPPKQFIPFMNRRLDNDGSDTAYRTSLYKKMKVFT